MNHPSEERLVLSRHEADRRVARHLDRCPLCRGRVGEIERLFAAVDSAPVPERRPAYGREVWSRLAPRLPREPETPGRRVFAPRLAFAGALAAVALAAFLAGRFWRGPLPAAPEAASRVRERILLVTIGDHLERSEAVLIELAHSPGGEPGAPPERERVEELLTANRLYRQSASSAGERAVADVLDDLERVLLEAAHRPGGATEALESLRRRAEAEGVLFKVRVLGSRVRQREEAIAPREERKRT